MRNRTLLFSLGFCLAAWGSEPDHDDVRDLRDAWSVFLLPASDDLDALPQDPLNPLTPEKVELGRLLFHDASLLVTPQRPEGKGTASCAGQ